MTARELVEMLKKQNRKPNFRRLIIHIPHGMGMGFGILLFVPLGYCWMLLCLFYQFIEDWRIKDNSYLDIRGYMVGMPLGVILYYIIRRYF